MRFRLPGWLLLPLLLASPLAAQVDLGPLFAPPTAGEIAAVRADWDARLPTPTDWTVHSTGASDGFTVQAVSHLIDGRRHYGALRFPRNYAPGRPYPVLLYLHGGVDGLYVPNLVSWDRDDPSGCTRDSFLVVAPAFRGEMLNGDGIVGTYGSDGPNDPFDTDADDAMALLTAVLLNVPEAAPPPVVVVGGSRGGNVAYHLALRDPRVVRTAIRAGPSDFFLAHVRQGAEQKLNTGATGDPLGRQVADRIAGPWLAGDLTLAQARHKLLAWSVAPLLDRPLALQIHHGGYDNVVPLLHSQAVDSVETALGAGPPDYRFVFYPTGGHAETSLPGFAANVAEYVCAAPRSVGVGGRLPAPPRLRSAPNPFRHRTRLSLAGEAGEKAAPPVRVSIYDLAGRRLRILPLAPAGDGVHRGTWDGRDAAGRRVTPGTYLGLADGVPGACAVKLIRRP